MPEFCARVRPENRATPCAARNKEFLVWSVFYLLNCCTNANKPCRTALSFPRKWEPRFLRLSKQPAADYSLLTTDNCELLSHHGGTEDTEKIINPGAADFADGRRFLAGEPRTALQPRMNPARPSAGTNDVSNGGAPSTAATACGKNMPGVIPSWFETPARPPMSDDVASALVARLSFFLPTRRGRGCSCP